jgi:hypothetical protein
MRLHEQYWEACDVLEAAGYTPQEAVALATMGVFPVPRGEDEVDLMDPCPNVSGTGSPADATADGWYTDEDYHKALVA